MDQRRQIMTAGELKKLIQNVPDSYDVTIYLENCVEAVWRDIDGKRNGVRGMIAELADPIPKDYRDNRPFHAWAESAGIVMWKGKNWGEFRIASRDQCPSLGGKNVQPEEEDAPHRLLLSSGQGIDVLRKGDGV
jgi:hypothetical protein